MEEFIEYIVKRLVDHPENVSIETRTSNDNKNVISLRVHTEDVGKVIGKKGKTAEAMRTLLTAIASREHQKAILEILD
jgi:uncharacterized protein